MSDYRNGNFDCRDRDSQLDANLRTSGALWGWISAAVFLLSVLGLAFVGHHPTASGTDVASTAMPPSAASRMSTTVPPPTATPAPKPTIAPPITPAPSTPAQGNGVQ